MYFNWRAGPGVFNLLLPLSSRLGTLLFATVWIDKPNRCCMIFLFLKLLWQFSWFSTGEAHLAPFQFLPQISWFLPLYWYNTVFVRVCLQGSFFKSYLGLLSTHSSVIFSGNFFTALFVFPDAFIWEFSFPCCFSLCYLRWETWEKAEPVPISTISHAMEICTVPLRQVSA